MRGEPSPDKYDLAESRMERIATLGFYRMFAGRMSCDWQELDCAQVPLPPVAQEGLRTAQCVPAELERVEVNAIAGEEHRLPWVEPNRIRCLALPRI